MNNGQERKTVVVDLNATLATKGIKGLAAASRKLRSDLLRMDPKSQEFKQGVKNLKLYNKEMHNLRGELRSSASAWDRFKTNAQGVMTGVLGANAVNATFDALKRGISGSIDAIVKKSDELSNIKKTTELADEEIKELQASLGLIDTRTGRSQLRMLAAQAGKLGERGVDDIAKFVEQANMIQVALGEDLGDDAIKAIAKSAQQFNESMLTIGSGINAVGASSIASEGFLVEFMSRVAPLAKTAKIAAGDVLGYGAVIDQAGLKVEKSTTALNKFFIDFIKNTDKYGKAAGFMKGELRELSADQGYNEAFLQMLTQLKEANPQAESFLAKLEELGISGDRGAQVFLALSDRIGDVREQQALANDEVAKGTSIIKEYDEKNNNSAARYEKAMKKIQAALKPLREAVGEMAIASAEWLVKNISGLKSLAKVLIVGASAWVGYKLAVILSDKANISFFQNLLKTETALKIQRLSTLAAAAAKALFTGNIKRASAAMRVFNRTTKLNPIGLLIGVITAATTAFSFFKTSADKATDAQEEFNDAVLAGQAILNNTDALQHQVNVRKKLSKAQLADVKSNIEQELKALETKSTKVIALQNKETANAKKNIDRQLDDLVKGSATGPAIDPNSSVIKISQRLSNEKLLTDNLEDEAKKREGINASEIASNKKKLEENLKAINAELAARPATKNRGNYPDEISKEAQKAKKAAEKLAEDLRVKRIEDAQKAADQLAEIQIELIDDDEEREIAQLQRARLLREREIDDLAVDAETKSKLATDETELMEKKITEITTRYAKKREDAEIKAAKTKKKLDDDSHQKTLDNIAEEKEKRLGALQEISNKTSQIHRIISDALSNQLDEFNHAENKKTDSLDARLQSGKISNEQYEIEKSKLEEEYDEKRRKIKKQQFIADKSASIIQGVIDTASAIIQAAPNIPLQIAAAVLGAAQIAVIAKQPMPEYERGGQLKGNRHTNGGITVNAEDGEVIINRRSAQRYLPELSAINEAGGGISFMSGNTPVPRFDTGGVVKAQQSYNSNRTFEDNPSNQMIIAARMMQQALGNIHVVSEAYITHRTMKQYDDDQNTIEDAGRF
jgi:TP901 family phage tail tape measure protein